MKKLVLDPTEKIFYTEIPRLSGDEEVVAIAGEGNIGWETENCDVPLIYKIRPLDKDGQLTPQYKKLMEQLHMVDLKPIDTANITRSKNVDRDILKWRKLQKKKQSMKEAANKRIEKLYDGYLSEEIQK